jgi:hypothetical protein
MGAAKMHLDELLERLNETQSLEALQPHWGESLASLGNRLPSFLTPEEYRENREWCGFGPEVDALLDEVARRIAADRGLCALAWHCHRLLFTHLDYTDQSFLRSWPSLEGIFGELRGIFYLLVVMGMVPSVRRLHASMDVPEEVTRETLSQVSCVSGNYRRMTGGLLGVTVNTLFWMRHYPAGKLFRLGRFEYKIEPFRQAIRVFRSRKTGETLALAPDGVRYSGEGHVDAENGWTATLTEKEDTVTGFPISPYGMAVRTQVTLAKAEWECVLKTGDPILEMHIPAGGGMTVERCGDSMRRAAAFFRRYFPEKPVRAITCVSWIFNTQFEEIQPRMENLLAYQHELYLHPVTSSGRDGLWFIFLRDEFDPATLPRDTSLRRGVADFLAAGNFWRCGGMFFLLDDLERFGTQAYRAQWPVSVVEQQGTAP